MSAPQTRKPRTNRTPTVLRLYQTGSITRPLFYAACLYQAGVNVTAGSCGSGFPDLQPHIARFTSGNSRIEGACEAVTRLRMVRNRLSPEARWIIDAVVLDGKTCVQVRAELQRDINHVLPAIRRALADLAEAYAAVGNQ